VRISGLLLPQPVWRRDDAAATCPEAVRLSRFRGPRFNNCILSPQP